MTSDELNAFMAEHGWRWIETAPDFTLFTPQLGGRPYTRRSTLLDLLALAGVEDPIPARFATPRYIYLAHPR
jgi:hypothetical protein